MILEGRLRHNWLAHWVNVRAVRRYAHLCRGRLLDIGCGEKPYERILSNGVTEYVGLEHPDTQHARDRVDVWGDAQDLPFDDTSFDSVCAFHVIEHTPQPSRVMAEAARVLRPNGTLLVAVPFMWGIHEAPRDFYRFTPYALRDLYARAGLIQVAIEPLCGYWATASLRLSYALARFARGPLRVPVLAFLSFVQGIGLVLDRLDPVETDAGGYIAIGRKPRAASGR
jgi:SAM-dependent methyltransferase